MCYEPRNEEFAKVCRERDELKAAYDGAKLAMKALNEKLVQVTAERDALLSIVKNWSECEHCKHVKEKLLEENCVPGEHRCYLCTMEKIPCCECSAGSKWEWKGVAEDCG